MTGARERCAACGKPRVTSWEWASTLTDDRDPGLCWAVSEDGCAVQRGGWRALHGAERSARERAEGEAAALRASAERYAVWHGPSCEAIGDNGPDACDDAACEGCAVDSALNAALAAPAGAALAERLRIAEAEAERLRAALAAAERERDAARARAERLRTALDALRASDDAALSALGHTVS